MNTFSSSDRLPRIPLQASIDLTYRCNNACRHCWTWAADAVDERSRELSTEEWFAVIDQARALGAREWFISGGEPMLREDFLEIFEYATGRAIGYTLNTNGTLITPAIARSLRRQGSKLIAVYGATTEVYDRVTRDPGGFDALLQGLAYLREAGAGFTVQLIPMRENWHQWEQMLAFARSWSESYRIGAVWLFKSACRGAAVDAEIERQRLDPVDVVRLEAPEVAGGEVEAADEASALDAGDDRVYAACIACRKGFHVDPYGGMSICSSVRDPALRYDLRAGSPVSQAAGRPPSPGIPDGAVEAVWEEFIPGLADGVRGGREYLESCGSCELRGDCRWCDVYSYLEHGRHGAKVDYLCAIARETRRYKEDWVQEHRRFYEIAGVTVQVDSDLPFTETTLDRKFEDFRSEGPGADTVVIRHHFGLPAGEGPAGAEEIYRASPWAVFRAGSSWIYHGITPDEPPELERVAVFSDDYTHAEIYNDAIRERAWLHGDVSSLTMFPTDQIVLAQLLADRGGCFLHSGAVALDDQGLLFIGHSDAGKSTTTLLLREALGERVRVLCDDRNIVRHWAEGYGDGQPGWYVHGTWSHGDVADCSAIGVPLRAILVLEQSGENTIVPLPDRTAVWQRLLGTLIKPLLTAEWYQKELDVLERIVADVPCSTMRFDRSGAIVPALERLVR